MIPYMKGSQGSAWHLMFVFLSFTQAIPTTHSHPEDLIRTQKFIRENECFTLVIWNNLLVNADFFFLREGFNIE